MRDEPGVGVVLHTEVVDEGPPPSWARLIEVHP